MTTQNDTIKTLGEYLADATFVQEVASLLPEDVNPAEWMNGLKRHLREEDKAAGDCVGHKHLFQGAIKRGAAIGLPWGDGLMRLDVKRANIPKGSQSWVTSRITAKVDSKGLVQLILMGGVYSDVYTAVAMEGETFQVIAGSSTPRLIHKPRYDIKRGRDNCIAAYVVLSGQGIASKFLIVDIEQIDASIMASKKQELYTGPNWAEMYKHIPVRKIQKLLPHDPRIKLALAFDDGVEFMDDPADDADTATDAPASPGDALGGVE